MVQTVQKKKPFTLTGVDYDILKLVNTYHFLTVSQMVRLRYRSGSETTCQDRLKRLFDAGVLDRVKLPHIGTGNTEFLYTLATRGQRELQTLGITNFTRFRSTDTHSLKLPHLQHLQSLNDFLIAAQVLTRLVPDITIASMQHDLDLKRTPLKVHFDLNGSGSRETIILVPDAFLDFRLLVAGTWYAMPVWVELDRGTEWGKTLKQKFRAIITAINTSAYQAMFGVNSITVAVATTEGEKRRDTMRSFVQQELYNMGLSHLANVFLFASLAQELEPQRVFLDPIWYTADNMPVPLLDMSE